MINTNVGYLIKVFRERLGFTQEELCEGLCEPSTLSKIENGHMQPGLELYNALSGKLNINIQYPVNLSQVEFKRKKIRVKIATSIDKNEFNYEILLNEFYDCNYFMNKFDKQFFLFSKANIILHKEKNYTLALELLLESINLTFTNYDVNTNLDKHLFFFTEFNILKTIAVALYKLKNFENAKRILIQMEKILISSNMSNEEIANIYPSVNLTLSNWFMVEKQYKDTIYYADKGINCSIINGKLFYLANLLYNKGFSTQILKGSDAPVILSEALILYKIQNNNEKLENSIRQIKENFGTDYYLRLFMNSVLAHEI